MPLKRPSSIMSRWKARWADTRACLRKLGLEAPPAFCLPPWSGKQIARLEREIGYVLPEDLREFFGTCASLIECSYDTPDAVVPTMRGRPRFTFDGYLSISPAALIGFADTMVQWSKSIQEQGADLPERYHFACPVGCVDQDEPQSSGIVCADRRAEYSGRIFIATEGDFHIMEEAHVANSVIDYIDVITDLVYWKPGRWKDELDFYRNRGYQLDPTSKAARERRAAFGLPPVPDRR